MSKIHVSNNGEQTAYTEFELKHLWSRGQFSREALYWREGMAEWKPLSEYFEPSPARAASRLPPLPVSPASPAVTASPRHSFQYTNDPRGLTAFLVYMLWVSLAMDLISILADCAQLSVLSRRFTEAEGAAVDFRQNVVGTISVITFIITGVAFLKWIHRANVNARGFGAQDMRFTPGWSVGAYFVPIVNLVRPFQVMKEIWQVSSNPMQWKSERSSPLLRGWWALWLLCGFFGQASFRMALNANSVSELGSATIISLASSLISVPLTGIAIALVKSIAAKQERLVTGAHEVLPSFAMAGAPQV